MPLLTTTFGRRHCKWENACRLRATVIGHFAFNCLTRSLFLSSGMHAFSSSGMHGMEEGTWTLLWVSGAYESFPLHLSTWTLACFRGLDSIVTLIVSMSGKLCPEWCRLTWLAMRRQYSLRMLSQIFFHHDWSRSGTRILHPEAIAGRKNSSQEIRLARWDVMRISSEKFGEGE